MPDALSGVSGASYQDTAATSQVNRPDQFNQDTFLKLLVAQLRYQDPSNPADSTQFIAQTAQFSQVQALNELTKQNANLLASQQLMSAGALVGHTVTYTDETGAVQIGKVTSVVLDPSNPTAMVNGKPVPIGRVTAITTDPTGAPASSTSA